MSGVAPREGTLHATSFVDLLRNLHNTYDPYMPKCVPTRYINKAQNPHIGGTMYYCRLPFDFPFASPFDSPLFPTPTPEMALAHPIYPLNHDYICLYNPYICNLQACCSCEAFSASTRYLKIREFSFVPLGFVPLGFGPLNHGIWPLIKVFGTPNLKLQGTKSKSLRKATRAEQLLDLGSRSIAGTFKDGFVSTNPKPY